MPNTGQDFTSMQQEPSFFSRQVRAAKRFYYPDCLLSQHTDQEFYVLAGGWESCAQGYRVERKNFPYYCIEFVVSGSGTVILDNIEHKLIPGMFFSYGPEISQIIMNDSKEPLEKYFITVIGGALKNFLYTELDIFGQVLHSARPHSLQQTFEELTNYGIERNLWSNKICTHLLRLLALKMAESAIRSENFSGTAYTNYLRCLSLLNQNYLKYKSLDDLADACSIDTSYLCKLFKKFNHQSPYQYSLRLSMNHAADILLQKNYQIQEVAEIMMYQDPLHFSRTFKKVMGLSPRDFIKLSKGNK